MNPPPTDEPWNLCYRQLAPKLLLYARQWLASAADAEDVVQTAFVKFWHRQPDARPEHWPLLYAAVRTTALDFLRSTDRRARREADPEVAVVREGTPVFDQSVEQREDAALLAAAVCTLPLEQREVLVLRIWGGLTFSEIADATGTSINTVAARHRYALDALRKQLKPYAHERL